MEDVMVKAAMVVTVPNPEGYVFGCKKCGQVYKRGTWAVGVAIENRNFLVGYNPPLQCCDEEKTAFQVFESEAEALALAVQVHKHLVDKQTTEGLLLYLYARPLPQSNSVH